MDLYSLLSRGYFPLELPPPFTTQHFAEKVNINPEILTKFKNYKEDTRLILHDIPRYGLYRRTLGIPNPIHYARLAEVIVENWNELRQKAERSPYSFSKPVEDTETRCITPENSIGGFIPHIMHTRANARYILKTDVSQFYASMYTHSIPWAMHGKVYIKNNRHRDLTGNSLDKLIRWGHHGQTLGIPIGPDISFLIGEIILSAVDKEIDKRIPELRGYRYIDDYEFSFKSYEEASETLTHIKRALKKFELSINERKTAILKLPVLIEETWVSELRSFIIEEDNRKHRKQRVDLIRYFDRSFQLVKQNPRDHVLNYSVQRLRAVRVHRENWKLVQDFLLQCMMIETGTIRSALFMLKEYADPEEGEYDLSRDNLSDVLNHQVWKQARNGYLNEVAWSIWAMLFWNIEMKEKAAEEVSKVEDSFVALLALDARDKGLIPYKLDVSIWEKYLDKEELDGIQWLLGYEAQIQGWLSGSRGNPLSSHPCFNELERYGIQFYDKTKMADLLEPTKPAY